MKRYNVNYRGSEVFKEIGSRFNCHIVNLFGYPSLNGVEGWATVFYEDKDSGEIEKLLKNCTECLHFYEET